MPADMPRLEEMPLVLRGFEGTDVPLFRDASSERRVSNADVRWIHPWSVVPIPGSVMR